MYTYATQFPKEKHVSIISIKFKRDSENLLTMKLFDNKL